MHHDIEMEVNDRGNFTYRGQAADQLIGYIRSAPGSYRSALENGGYQQWHTMHDSHYFNIWVHVNSCRIVICQDLECTVVQCTTADSFQEEISVLAEFYGECSVDMTSVNPLLMDSIYKSINSLPI